MELNDSMGWRLMQGHMQKPNDTYYPNSLIELWFLHVLSENQPLVCWKSLLRGRAARLRSGYVLVID